MSRHDPVELIVEPLLTYRAAAKVLGVTERTIWTLVNRHDLPVVRFGRSVRIDPADLRSFIERSKVERHDAVERTGGRAISAAVETVLSALRSARTEPRQRGKAWSARCPAHDDRNPSLSIGVGGDGRALLKCHAGCSTAEVVGALGLEMSDLMPERQPVVTQAPTRPRRSKRSAPATESGTPADFRSASEALAALERTLGPCARNWTYTDAAGAPVGQIARWDTPSGKEIRPVALRGDGWVIGAMPEPRPLLGLAEFADLPDGAWVYVVEGEACVDAARSIGVVATTSAGGSKAAAKSDWSVLKNKVAVILPDHDDAVESFAETVADLCHAAGADEFRIVRLRDRWPELPDGGDLVDVLALAGGDIEAAHEALDDFALSTGAEPRPPETSGRSTYTPFPSDALPEPVRAYVMDAATAIGCDESYVALPLLSGLAAAVGNTRRIVLKRGWTEPAIVWTAVMGESGAQKSPAFRIALKAVRDRQHRLIKEHQAAMTDWESQHALHEIAMSNWKKAAAKSADPPEAPKAPERPICPRSWIEDCTTEALAMLLQQNPRGLLTLRNELSGWFSFGQYKNDGGADDVARWLQMFDGDALIVDRKTSGTIYVPCAAVSIAGGILPAILERSLGQQHRDNGLLARLLTAHPPRRAKRWTETVVESSLEEAMTGIFDRMYAVEPDLDDGGDPRPRMLPLTAAAKQAWIAFVNEHGEEQLQYVGDEAAAWSKLEGYAARLALVIHCSRVAAEDPSLEDAEQIDVASIDAGIRLSRWFADEALRIYRMQSGDAVARDRRRLVELIERHGGAVSVREWQRVRSHKRAKDAKAELDALAEADIGAWQAAAPGPRGGRPSRRLVLSGVVAPT